MGTALLPPASFLHRRCRLCQGMTRGVSAWRVSIAALAFLLLVGAGGEAFAHAKLVSSNPAANATVTPPPISLILKFSESIEIKFAQVRLSDASGAVVATGSPTQDPADRGVVIVEVSAPLTDGRYTVSWQVVAADGHKTKGTYHFNAKK
jgi:copper resistance protein C